MEGSNVSVLQGLEVMVSKLAKVRDNDIVFSVTIPFPGANCRSLMSCLDQHG